MGDTELVMKIRQVAIACDAFLNTEKEVHDHEGLKFIKYPGTKGGHDHRGPKTE